MQGVVPCSHPSPSIARRLLNPLFDPGDPGLGDDVPVFHDLIREESFGLVEVERDRDGADLFKPDSHGLILQRFVQRGVQSLLNVPGYAGGRAEAGPAAQRIDIATSNTSIL